MSKILLVDLSGIWRQKWHAGGSREVNNANEVVMGLLDKYWYNYDHVAVCGDGPPYKRNEMYPDYKGDRQPKSEEMTKSLDKLVVKIAKRGFPIFAVEGWEADDVVATLAKQYRDHDVTILSSDKDLIPITQLSMDITWHSPLTGKTLDAMGVKEECGCSPAAFELAIAFDGANDNIPGVKGIGLKTACKIAAEYPTIELLEAALIDCPDKVPKSKLILENIQNLRISSELVKLNYDLELDHERLMQKVGPPPIEEEEMMEQAETVCETEVVKKEVQSTEIVVQGGRSWSNALEPTGMAEAQQVSKWLCDSGLFKAFRSPQAVLAAIMLGRDLGMPGAATSLNSIHVINGTPTLKTEAKVALVNCSGKADYLKVVESTDERCTVRTHRTDDPDPSPTTVTFTMDHARNLGLTGKDNWVKQPDTMLMWRALSKIMRICYPEITMGLYSTEEME